MNPATLPDDLEALKALVRAQAEQLAEKDAALAQSEQKLALIQRELDALQRRITGRHRGERFVVSPDQVALFAAAEAPVPVPTTRGARARKGRDAHGRSRLPAHLPRAEIVRDVPKDAACSLCGGELKPIGEAVSERLDWIPGRFVVLKVRRQKCACPEHGDAGVVTAPEPALGLPRAKAGPGLVAKVVVDKYVDHIPLHRQARRFQRAGLDLAVSTLSGWVMQLAGYARPLVEAQRRRLLRGDWLQSDGTGLPVLVGPKNRPEAAHLWVYANGEDAVCVVTPDKSGQRHVDVLDGFTGTLLVDGESTYNLIARQEGVDRAGCWAHARRYFREALDEDPLHAEIALATIRELFIVERVIRTASPEVRQRSRTEQLEPVLARFRDWLLDRQRRTPPGGAMGRAIGYTLNQWTPLTLFLHRPAVPIHNNTSERLLRQTVIGRKNWLFAGSWEGARAAADLYSLVASCTLNRVDPWLYFADMLPRLVDHPINRVLELSPSDMARQHRELAEETAASG